MNIKSLIISVVVMMLILTGYHFLFNARSYSLAYVDSSRLMTEYKAMEDVKKTNETRAKTWQSNVDTLALELQNDIKKYEKERGQMSEREKKTTEELIGRKQQQFMQYKEVTKNKAAEEEQKITNEALAKVNSVITEFGKKHNYTFVFGTTSGNIVYASEAVNVTDRVLEVLNSQYEQNK